MSNTQDTHAYNLLCQLLEVRENLHRKRSTALERCRDLVFLYPPGPQADTAGSDSLMDRSPEIMNTGAFALIWNATANSVMLTYEEWLSNAIEEVKHVSNCDYIEVLLQAKTLRCSLEAALEELEEWKSDEWDRQRCATVTNTTRVDGSDHGVDTDYHMHTIIHEYRPRLLLLLLLAATLHLLCGLSIEHSLFLMAALKLVVSFSDDGHTVDMNNIDSKALPGDIRGVITALQLDPKTDHFVCCIACFALYPCGEDNQFPPKCTHKRAGDAEECGADLYVTRRVKGKTKKYPCRKFVRNDFQDWFGKLLCRPNVEAMMDKCVENASIQTLTDRASDIWEAPALHAITLPDGRPFIAVDGSEGRYVFSICIDGFNPGGKGAPMASVGSIFFACLNLPPDLRYKPENMYLAGVIPGPKHPSKEELNHILENVLEPFRGAYQQGIWYSRTPSQPLGRKATVVVLPLVADTLAAQQMNGNAPHNHQHFCPFCKITKHDIQNLDYKQWTKRVCKSHISTARAWLRADTEEQRELIYNATGVRWSALFTLPYWDAVRHIAIDPMHLFYLGLFRHHCRNVWGMDADEADGLDGITHDQKKSDPSQEEMDLADHILRHGKAEELEALRADVVRELAKQQGIVGWAQKNKKDLIKYLKQLRISKGWFTQRGRPIGSPVTVAPEVFESDKEDSASVKQVLKDIETQSVLSLAKYRFSTLAAACRKCFGGLLASYESKSTDELTRLIEEHRRKLNVGNEKTIPDHRNQLPRGVGHEDADVSEEQYQGALEILEKGNKTALHKLKIASLAALCYRKASTPRSNMKRSRAEFLQILHDYRVTHQITNKEGKLLGHVPRLGQDERASDAEEMTEIEDAIYHGTRKTILTFRPLALAQWIFKTLGVSVRGTKVAVMKVIDEHRAQKGITGKRGKLITETIPKRTRILGRNTLGRVWSDMATLRAPSWLTKPPSRAGETGAGGLGADEWRTFCTVNLPVTLISMWGLKPEGSRERALLDNFMDLVTAISLASKRVTDRDRREKYQTYMHRYLTTLLQLFPATKMVSNQHKALHFADVLEFLGPAHVLWCYGFERGNYELQKVKTNNRIYDIPETLSRRFCQQQNLRFLFSKAVLPPVLHDLITSFMRSFGRGSQRGTLQNGMMGIDVDSDEVRSLVEEIPGIGHDDMLGQYLQDALQERISAHGYISTANRIKRLPALTIRGNVFKPETTSPGDSYIKFQLNGDSDWRAGCIQEIFTYRVKIGSTGEFQDVNFIGVDEFVPLLSTVNDPFKRYLEAGRLFNPQYETKSLVLLPQEIECHCALSTPFIDDLENGGQYIHVLPLDKW